jgi:hypothetical protein
MHSLDLTIILLKRFSTGLDFRMIPGVGIDEVSILRFLSVSIPHAKTA